MGKHAGAQQPIAVIKFEPHRRRARGGIQGRVQISDLGLETALGKGLDPQDGRLADAHPRQILLVHIGNHPHGAQIGNAVNRHAGRKAHALDRFFLQHHAAGRRAERNARRIGPAGAHLPMTQALAGRKQQPLGTLARHRLGRAGAIGEALCNLHFLARRHQLRAIHRKQRLTTLDRVTAGIDVQPLDPALEARRHIVNGPLVDLHPAHRAHGRVEHLHRRPLSLDAQRLQSRGADTDRTAIVGRIVGIHRDVVHAHRVLLGRGRGIRQPHGIAVVKRLALTRGGVGGCRGGLRLDHGSERQRAGHGGKIACASGCADEDGNKEAVHSGAPVSCSMSTTRMNRSTSASSRARRVRKIRRSASIKVLKLTRPVSYPASAA